MNFDQGKFEQLLTGDSKNPLRVRKHRKVSVASVPLAIFGKQVSDETIEVLYKPNSTSCEANQALCEPITVPAGTKLAPHQRVCVAREPSRVPCEPKIASAKAMWIAKSILGSLESAFHEAKIVLDYNTPSASQLRLSREAKVKAPCA